MEDEEDEEEEEEEEDDDDDNDDGAEASIDLQESESRDRSEELDVPESQPDSLLREHSITGNSPADLPSAFSSPAPLSFSPVPPSSPQSSPNLQLHDNRAFGSLAGYDPSLRFDILANDGLIMIVEAWDFFYFHQRLQQGNMGPHPQLERVMEELQIRGIAHEHRSWISGAMHRAWTLELEGVDMKYVRVKVNRSGS